MCVCVYISLMSNVLKLNVSSRYMSAWISASEMVYDTTYSRSDELAALIHKAGER